MNHDGQGSDVVAATGGGATIKLWRAPNRIWRAFPTLVLVRAASRLGRGPAKRRSPAISEGGVVSVLLDGSKLGAISPKQITVYQVSAGEHSLSLHFLAGLRRSRKLRVSLAEGEEKKIVCLLNAFGWPSIRPATPNDVVSIERLRSACVDGSEPGLGFRSSGSCLREIVRHGNSG